MDETSDTSTTTHEVVELLDTAAEQLRSVLHAHPGRIDVAPPEAYRIVAEAHTVTSRLGELVERLERGLAGWERPLLRKYDGVDADDAARAVQDAQVALLQGWHALNKAYGDLTAAQDLLAPVWMERP